MLAAITGADLAILDFIYDNLHCAFLDAVMPVITALGNGGILFIAIAVVMLFFKRTRKTGLMIGCALILGLLVCNLTLKPIVARERPFTHRAVELLVSRPKDFSFPSGHTIASFEFATVLFLRERKAGIIALVAAVLTLRCVHVGRTRNPLRNSRRRYRKRAVEAFCRRRKESRAVNGYRRA